jgi:hypothetical protein
MGNIQFLNIVTNSLVQDKLMAEEELERTVLGKNENTEEKLQQIRCAIKKYGEAVNNLAYWENYVKENITIPGQNVPSENPPSGNNNN